MAVSISTLSDVESRTREFFAHCRKASPNADILVELATDGIRVDAVDKDGWTPLHVAAFGGWLTLASLLLERGSAIGAKNFWGGEPLLVTALGRQAEMAAMLLARGAQVDARDNNGDTALLLSAGLGHRGLVSVLLERGANIHAEGCHGHSPEEYDSVSGHPAVSRWRELYGEFVKGQWFPASAGQVFQLLAVWPLANPEAPVDTAEHLRQLFAPDSARSNEETRRRTIAIIAELQKLGLPADQSESLRAMQQSHQRPPVSRRPSS